MFTYNKPRKYSGKNFTNKRRTGTSRRFNRQFNQWFNQNCKLPKVQATNNVCEPLTGEEVIDYSRYPDQRAERFRATLEVKDRANIGPDGDNVTSIYKSATGPNPFVARDKLLKEANPKLNSHPGNSWTKPSTKAPPVRRTEKLKDLFKKHLKHKKALAQEKLILTKKQYTITKCLDEVNKELQSEVARINRLKPTGATPVEYRPLTETVNTQWWHLKRTFNPKAPTYNTIGPLVHPQGCVECDTCPTCIERVERAVVQGETQAAWTNCQRNCKETERYNTVLAKRDKAHKPSAPKVKPAQLKNPEDYNSPPSSPKLAEPVSPPYSPKSPEYSSDYKIPRKNKDNKDKDNLVYLPKIHPGTPPIWKTSTGEDFYPRVEKDLRLWD